MLHSKFILGHIGILVFVKLVKCTIDGISYMDPIIQKPLARLYPPGEDPCNPLYWYPRNIPEYCNYRNPPPIAQKPVPPLPIPIPVPIPQVPQPVPIPMPVPALPSYVPAPMGLAPMPYGMPTPPTNSMLPFPPMLPTYPYTSNSYPSPPASGMVPGIHGLVTRDGGINILPFSDAYSDLLEKHKNRMIRRRLRKLIEDYEDFPNGRSLRRLRKYARENM